MLHELWLEGDGQQTFCLAGPRGDRARALLAPGAALAWTIEAGCVFDAMTLYWARMGWGAWTTDFPDLDKRSYRELGWE